MIMETVNIAKALRDDAEINRKMGDGYLRQKPPQEKESIKAFKGGVELLKQALELLKKTDSEKVKSDLVETHGSLGGLYRRLGNTHWEDALDAYVEGAKIEREFDLPSTYNRLNALKLKLLLGKSRLAATEQELGKMVDLISMNLRTDSEARESGWAYADLGDCLALLDHLEEAEKAYATFIGKAESASPKTTLKVLNELAKVMTYLKDPDAGRVSRAAAQLEQNLN